MKIEITKDKVLFGSDSFYADTEKAKKEIKKYATRVHNGRVFVAYFASWNDAHKAYSILKKKYEKVNCREKYEKMKYNELRKIASEAGYNVYRITKDELIDLLAGDCE